MTSNRYPLLALLVNWFLSMPAYGQASVTKPLAPLPQSDSGAPLSFNEEFLSLSASPDGRPGWKTRYYHGERTLLSNHEAQFYADASTGDDPFRIVDNQLEITAKPCAGHGTLAYCSGLLTSQTLFTQRWGYFEMRAKLPRGKGLWPAFWLLPAGGGWPPEIDVVEMLGARPDVIYASIHWQADQHRSHTEKVKVADTADGFHVYGVSWHPDLLRWYFDGAEIAQAPTPPGLDQPMHMLVNLAVGGAGSWPGAPDAETTFPARMRVDYVRAYRYSDTPGRP